MKKAIFLLSSCANGNRDGVYSESIIEGDEIFWIDGGRRGDHHHAGRRGHGRGHHQRSIK